MHYQNKMERNYANFRITVRIKDGKIRLFCTKNLKLTLNLLIKQIEVFFQMVDNSPFRYRLLT